MAETTTTSEKAGAGRRKILIGEVVSTKMAKTIVVEVRRQKAHPFYKRVVSRSKKFYAHDEDGTAHLGDVVKIEETRPLSKLKRWRLLEIVRRGTVVGAEAEATTPELVPSTPKPRLPTEGDNSHVHHDANHARGGRQQRRPQITDDLAGGRPYRPAGRDWR